MLIAALLTGCTDDPNPDDPLQVTDNPAAATPAKSPKSTKKPAGRVVDVGGKAAAVVMRPGRVVAVEIHGDSSAVVTADLDRLDAKPHRGEPGHVLPREVKLGDTELVPVGREGVLMVTGQGVEQTIRGELASADQVVVSGGKAAVLDRRRSALFDLDVDAGEIGLGLRAGEGATNATSDRYGRVLVVDTRSEALLAFSLDPVLLRQRYPVKGAPYGIAYDAKRDLAWITLTARNEVVGYAVAGGEPKELHRFPTVRQPNSVTVDEHTGSVVVASAAGEGIQVIEP